MTLPLLDARCALFLDVDGTLLHIADRPQDVRVGDGLVRMLAQVHSRLSGAVALISGRALSEVDTLVAPLVLPACGQHGVERRNAQGHLQCYAGSAPEAGSRRLAAFAAAHPGVLFEDKGASLALHYRLAPELAGAVWAQMQALGEELGPHLQLLRGKMVVELKPAGLHKGRAIEQFMAEVPFRGRVPVFAGDDTTDEDGFAVVNRLGGCSVKVGEGPTCALTRLPGVAAVHEWLALCASSR